MSTPVATRDESNVIESDVPAEYGLLSGFATFFLGFAITFSWVAREVEASLSGINAFAGLFGQSAIPTWKAVGWVFYNAHFVTLEIPVPGGSSLSRDLIAAQGGSVALYLVPPVLLTLAGFLVARQVGDFEDVRAGARAGATIVVGYLLVAIAGAFVTSVDAFGAMIAPDLLGAAAVAGLLYPLVFGSFGGAVAAVIE